MNLNRPPPPPVLLQDSTTFHFPQATLMDLTPNVCNEANQVLSPEFDRCSIPEALAFELRGKAVLTLLSLLEGGHHRRTVGQMPRQRRGRDVGSHRDRLYRERKYDNYDIVDQCSRLKDTPSLVREARVRSNRRQQTAHRLCEARLCLERTHSLSFEAMRHTLDRMWKIVGVPLWCV